MHIIWGSVIRLSLSGFLVHTLEIRRFYDLNRGNKNVNQYNFYYLYIVVVVRENLTCKDDGEPLVFL